jgi:hypothetical protein
VHFSDFGTGDPAHEGIRATMLATLPEVGAPRPWRPLGAGIYALSATMLQQVYSPVRGEWNLPRERSFSGCARLSRSCWATPRIPPNAPICFAARPQPTGTPPGAGTEWLRLARLGHYLRLRRPEANINGSILVYRLSAAEITAAARGSLRDWQELIERTVAAR